MRHFIFFALFCSTGIPSLFAAAPKLELIYPAGAGRGSTVTVTLTGAVDPWPVQVWCSRPELQFKTLDEKGKLSITVPAECPVGPAWIRIFNAEGASTVRPFMISSLPEFEEVEPNNAMNQIQAVPGSSAIINGKHQANNDVDVFSMPLKAGQTLVADLEAHRSLGSPADPVLQILNDQGFVLDQNDDDQGLDPRLVFTAPNDGTYLVRTFAFPAATDSSIHFSGGPKWIYRLTMTTGPFVDFVMPPLMTRAVAGEVLAFGQNLGTDPLKLSLPADDADRVLLTAPQLGNFRSLLSVPFPVQIEVEPNSTAMPQVIPVPAGVAGVISTPDDVDVFSFPAKKGQPLILKIFARSVGSPIDPVLSIFDSMGKQLQRIDDQGENRDPEITWNPPADGQYQVRVSDLHDRSGPRFFYHVNIAPPQPSAHLSLAADSFALPADKPLEIPVTIDRQGGYKGELDITITGLPEGVTAAPVKSAGDGDTAKSVKLLVTGNGSAFSGPIQVIATTTTDPKTTRKARFVIADCNSEINQFWLTSIKK